MSFGVQILALLAALSIGACFGYVVAMLLHANSERRL